jgi:hypothetical protein
MKGLFLTARDRRVLIAGTSIVIGVLALSRGWPAARGWQREVMASATELSAEARRAEASAAALPALRDTLSYRMERFVGLAPRLLTGSPTGVGAALISWVSEAAGEGHLRLGSTHMSVDTVPGGLMSVVTVRLDAHGDVGGLTHLLRVLEESDLFVAVRELSVTQPEPHAAPDRPESLRIEMLIEALALRQRPTEES